MEIIYEHLSVGHILSSKSFFSSATVLIFFHEYFKPGILLFKAREIADLEVPFGMSPNSVNPS